MTGPSFDAALEVVSALYEAALEPALWPEVMGALRALFDSQTSALLIEDTQRGGFSWATTFGYSDAETQTYIEHYSGLDEAMIALRKKPRLVALNTDYVEERDLLNSEFYCDFHRKLDLFYVMGSLVDLSASEHMFLGLQKPHKTGGFPPDELRLFHVVAPHVQRALQMQRRLAETDALRAAGFGALDALAAGVLVVSRTGTVVFANRAAEDLLRRNDGIGIRRGRLAAARAAETAALEALIHGATLTVCGIGGTLALPRPSGRRPLLVLVAPLLPGAGARFPDLGLSEPLAVVLLVDPEREVRPPAALLRQMYGLTAREANLALNLATGRSLETAAETMAITRETARTYVKRVFSKTDTARQAELVALLLKSLGVGFLG